MIGDLLGLWDDGQLAMVPQAFRICRIDGLDSEDIMAIYNAICELDGAALRAMPEENLFLFWKFFCSG